MKTINIRLDMELSILLARLLRSVERDFGEGGVVSPHAYGEGYSAVVIVARDAIIRALVDQMVPDDFIQMDRLE